MKYLFKIFNALFRYTPKPYTDEDRCPRCNVRWDDFGGMNDTVGGWAHYDWGSKCHTCGFETKDGAVQL